MVNRQISLYNYSHFITFPSPVSAVFIFHFTTFILSFGFCFLPFNPYLSRKFMHLCFKCVCKRMACARTLVYAPHLSCTFVSFSRTGAIATNQRPRRNRPLDCPVYPASQSTLCQLQDRIPYFWVSPSHAKYIP